jgi:hypothetical protein
MPHGLLMMCRTLPAAANGRGLDCDRWLPLTSADRHSVPAEEGVAGLVKPQESVFPRRATGSAGNANYGAQRRPVGLAARWALPMGSAEDEEVAGGLTIVCLGVGIEPVQPSSPQPPEQSREQRGAIGGGFHSTAFARSGNAADSVNGKFRSLTSALTFPSSRRAKTLAWIVVEACGRSTSVT